MTNTAQKDFGDIRDDYAFFQNNSTERERDLAGYAERVRPFVEGRQSLALLDFGCGPGNFTSHFLEMTGLRPDQLELSLVEPEPGYLQTSLATLRNFSHSPPRSWPVLPSGMIGRFDLILSNHALYYVPDLGGQIEALFKALRPGGMFTTAMAGKQNQLIRIWQLAFGLIHQPIPYNILENLKATLEEKQIPFQATPVRYFFEFPETVENRHKVLRFLLSNHLDRMPLRPLETWFDSYARDGRIHLDLQHEQITIFR